MSLEMEHESSASDDESSASDDDEFKVKVPKRGCPAKKLDDPEECEEATGALRTGPGTKKQRGGEYGMSMMLDALSAMGGELNIRAVDAMDQSKLTIPGNNAFVSHCDEEFAVRGSDTMSDAATLVMEGGSAEAGEACDVAPVSDLGRIEATLTTTPLGCPVSYVPPGGESAHSGKEEPNSAEEESDAMDQSKLTIPGNNDFVSYCDKEFAVMGSDTMSDATIEAAKEVAKEDAKGVGKEDAKGEYLTAPDAVPDTAPNTEYEELEAGAKATSSTIVLILVVVILVGSSSTTSSRSSSSSRGGIMCSPGGK